MVPELVMPMVLEPKFETVICPPELLVIVPELLMPVSALAEFDIISVVPDGIIILSPKAILLTLEVTVQVLDPPAHDPSIIVPHTKLLSIV